MLPSWTFRAAQPHVDKRSTIESMNTLLLLACIFASGKCQMPPTRIVPPPCIEQARVRHDEVTEILYANSHCRLSYQTFVGPTVLRFADGGHLELQVADVGVTLHAGREAAAVEIYRVNAWNSQEEADKHAQPDHAIATR